LETQPFMLSSAVLGSAGTHSQRERAEPEDNFMAGFSREPGRHER
jgi:hypothetical protein